MVIRLGLQLLVRGRLITVGCELLDALANGGVIFVVFNDSIEEVGDA